MIKYDVAKYFDRLPGRGVNYCFNGLLRSFCSNDNVWTAAWSLHSGLGFDFSKALIYDVFGNVYFIDGFDDQMAILSLDSGDMSVLDVDVDNFFSAIEIDPVSTIRSDLYEEARLKLGGLSESQNYALKVEAALGGNFCVDNMYICDRLKHAIALGEIACQIKNMPIGTRLKLAN